MLFRSLKAPRKLTKDEYTAMQEHSIIGANILKKSHLSLFQLASEVAMYHHEKYDGNGYPEGLSGENIPESARIVALADVFDALTMRRPYKEPWSDEDALKEIQQCSGTHFDPTVVDIFVDIFPKLCDIKLKWEKNP